MQLLPATAVTTIIIIILTGQAVLLIITVPLLQEVIITGIIPIPVRVALIIAEETQEVLTLVQVIHLHQAQVAEAVRQDLLVHQEHLQDLLDR